MTINLCELLGVTENEEFKLHSTDDRNFEHKKVEDRKFKIENNTLYSAPVNLVRVEAWQYSSLSLNTIAELELEKLPFTPEFGDEYFTVKCTPKGFISVMCATWTGNMSDILRLEQGLAFRTREEANKIGVIKSIEIAKKWGINLEYEC